MHADSDLITSSGVSGIDLNRAGTPLIEVVTEPDIRTADEAVAWGLANQLVAAADIRDEALAFGQHIASMKPGSVCHSKQLLRQNRRQIAVQLNEELAHFVQHIVTEEGIGGFREYVNKNKARQAGV